MIPHRILSLVIAILAVPTWGETLVMHSSQDPRQFLQICEVAEVNGESVLLLTMDQVDRSYPVRLLFGRPRVHIKAPSSSRNELAEIKRVVDDRLLGRTIDTRQTFNLGAGWVSKESLRKARNGRDVQIGETITLQLSLDEAFAIDPLELEPDKCFVPLTQALQVPPAELLQQAVLQRVVNGVIRQGSAGILLCAWAEIGTEKEDLYGRHNHTLSDILNPERPTSDHTCAMVATWAAAFDRDVKVLHAVASNIATFTGPDWPKRLESLWTRVASAGGTTELDLLHELLQWCAWTNDAEALQLLRPDLFVYGRTTYSGDLDRREGTHASREPAFWNKARSEVPASTAVLALLGGATDTLNLLTDDLIDPNAPIVLAGNRGSSLLHFAAALGERELLRQFAPSRFEDEMRERRDYLETLAPIENPLDPTIFGSWIDVRPFWNIEATPAREIVDRAMRLELSQVPTHQNSNVGSAVSLSGFEAWMQANGIDEDPYGYAGGMYRANAMFEMDPGEPWRFRMPYDPVAGQPSQGSTAGTDPRNVWSFDGRLAHIPARWGNSTNVVVIPLDHSRMGPLAAKSTSGQQPGDHFVILYGEERFSKLCPAAGSAGGGSHTPARRTSAGDKEIQQLLDRRTRPIQLIDENLSQLGPGRHLRASAEAMRKILGDSVRIRPRRELAQKPGGECRLQALHRLATHWVQNDPMAHFDPRWQAFVTRPEHTLPAEEQRGVEQDHEIEDRRLRRGE
jgi:hypothetical protein